MQDKEQADIPGLESIKVEVELGVSCMLGRQEENFLSLISSALVLC